MDLTASAVLRSIAARQLGGVVELPHEPLDDRAWRAFAGATSFERLWGEVADALETADLAATDEQADEAFARHADAMATALELEALALDAVDLLGAAGLEVRLLKGMATAHLDHPDPARRSFGDVDLLVAPGRFRATLDVLEAAGWRRDLPERRPGFDERFGKDGTLEHDGPGQIDLHRTLALGPFGLWIDLDELWTGKESLRLADRDVDALDAPRRLLHAAYGAILSDRAPRLSLQRDLALLARRPGALDDAVDLARSWNGEIVIAEALRETSTRLGLAPWPDVTPAGNSAAARVALRCYDSQGGSNTRLLLAGALALPRWRDRAAYLRALVSPTAEYRRAREAAGRPAEWRRGVRELVSRRR